MRRIFVKVKTKAKKEEVLKLGADEFLVSVKEPAEEGKANVAIIKALARYFKVPTTSVKIVSGRASRKKRIEIIS